MSIFTRYNTAVKYAISDETSIVGSYIFDNMYGMQQSIFRNCR
jgi:hypothetical protein